MLDHITISVPHIKRSSAFYEQALAPLGIKRLVAYGGTADEPDHFGFGSESPFLFLGQGNPNNGYLHIALTAPSREAVDAFHHAALAAGGSDNGPPGIRSHYHSGYYAAFVITPDGCNLEAVHHSSSSQIQP